MEDLLHSHLPALASLLALLLVLWSAWGSRSRARRSSHELALPPKIPGSWPIIGHLHLLRKPIPLARILAAMSDSYGPIFILRLGVHPTVVISTHESVRECFTTNDRTLASRPLSKGGIHMGYNYAAFGFARYDRYCREIRKIVASELLGLRQLEALRQVQVSEINTLIRGLYDSAVAAGKPAINISQWLENTTLNIITRMITGKKYFGSGNGTWSCSQAEAAHVTSVIKEFMHTFGFPAISDLIPCTGWTDIVGTVRTMKWVARELDKIVGSWVEEHKRRWAIDGERTKQDMDFIDVMLSVIKENSMLGYSKETIIKATVMNIIVAASDTTSLNLTWAISLLLNHRHSLDKAQEELDLKIGRDRWVRYSDIENLPYLQAIIKEVLRLYPPAPVSVPHESDQDCIVNGYLIPKGTRLMVNLWKLHRDPRIWPDPNRFLPERFLPGGHAAGVDGSGQHFEFIPFGSGRRACPGSAMAFQVTHLALALLLQAFDMSTPGNAPVDMAEGISITLPKVSPVEIVLAPRLPAGLEQEKLTVVWDGSSHKDSAQDGGGCGSVFTQRNGSGQKTETGDGRSGRVGEGMAIHGA